MTAKWQAERDKRASATGIKEKLEQARTELEQAKREGNLARAGELSYGVIPGLERQLAEADAREDGLMVEEAVRPEQIAEVVERWTGIPTSEDAGGRARESSSRWKRSLASASSASGRRLSPSRTRCAVRGPG
jgi:ATP-dependent Clp protease ATP-binding subunit ClpA